MNKYPNLTWLFKNHPLKINEGVLKLFFEKNSEILEEYDNLIKGLRKYNCKKIQENINDSKDLNKLDSSFREFEYGLLFAENGYDVEFILDDDPAFVKDKSSPDIKAINGNNSVLIEVTKLTDSLFGKKIFEKINNFFIKDFNRDYAVTIEFDKDIAIPVVDGTSRCIQECLYNSSWNAFKKWFKNNKQKEFPEMIQCKNLTIFFNPIEEKGFFAGFYTETYGFSDENEDKSELYRNYLYDKIISKKAEKKIHFPPPFDKFLYIIAIDIDNFGLDESDIDKKFYGANVFHFDLTGKPVIVNNYSDKMKVYTNEIENLKEKGWISLLSEKGFLLGDVSCIEEPGVFLTESNMKNVSAILVKIHKNRIKLFPNPFSDDNINCPDFKINI